LFKAILLAGYTPFFHCDFTVVMLIVAKAFIADSKLRSL